MRLTTLSLALTVLPLGLATACVGEVGADRKPGRGSGAGSDQTGGPCTRIEHDVTIRSAADMAALPRTGCYDIHGKLTVQGQAITSLAGLDDLDSVDDLDLDHTAIAAIDTRRPVGIHGKLTVTGNTRLVSLAQLSFETASTGILIDGNPALTSLDPLDAPRLEEVDGDLAVRNNPVLASLGTMSALYRVTGSVTIDGNPALANLAAFTTSLEFIDQSLTINDNLALVDLGALKHVALVGAITITGNASLVSCRATEVDRCVQHPVASVIANNNNVSCTTSCN